MQAPYPPILRDIVLVGGGHSHVAVLKAFAMRPVAGVRLTLVCTDVDTPYSGMLPGYIAGHYGYDDVHIDLANLCAYAHARFYKAAAIGIDRTRKQVMCSNRPPVDYDLLSLNIGSCPHMQNVPGAGVFAVPVKPIANFNARWQALLSRYEAQADAALQIAVVGGGAGGVELILAMQHRMPRARFSLLTQSTSLLPTHNLNVQKRLTQVLAERGIQIYTHTPVTQLAKGQLFSHSRVFSCDEVIWATQAGAAAWLADTGLALDRWGFVQVSDGLQSVNDPSIFAAGDIAAMVNHPLDKAGVVAVRQGMPLAQNLRRALLGQALKAYSPPRRWLALISTGDQQAVASRGMFSITKPSLAGVIWRWKNAIDRRFMRQFNVTPADFARMLAAPRKPAMSAHHTASNHQLPLSAEESHQALSALLMRCGGCGAKVGATVLSRALRDLNPIDNPDVLIGLQDPDDAAVVRVPPGHEMVHTVDFFRAMLNDPYRFGQIAAQHALGDIFAMGAKAQSATAIATLPPGLDIKLEATLRDLMTGAVEVFNAAGCSLVGGHTAEGQELALGFAINGYVQLAKTLRKGGMKAGDKLILTKPIGTGVLLAALPLGWAKGRWIEAALSSMLTSNQSAAQCLLAHGATACTDVTGFGLIGHLVEMTKASGFDAEIELSHVPLLSGAQACAAGGISSSLYAANLKLKNALQPMALEVDPALQAVQALLFDPQTAGGLLASVPADHADRCLEQLIQNGYPAAAIIGRVVASPGDKAPIHVRP